jgi:putative endopeptidase
MTPDTKKQAHAKLAKIAVKVGYPDKWRDYSSLAIKRDDLVGNVMRAREFAPPVRREQAGQAGRPQPNGT